VIKHAVYNKSG